MAATVPSAVLRPFNRLARGMRFVVVKTVGASSTAKDLATGEISSVIGRSRRGQLRLTSRVALSATAVKEK
jgi:hypothetical protein